MQNIIKILTYTVTVIYIILMATHIANRDLYAVGDTMTYKSNFETSLDTNFGYEFFFEAITYLIRLITNNYILYFFLLNIILNLFLIINALFLAKFYQLKSEAYLPLFLCTISISSWYHSSAANGLRQGIALALLYIALYQLVLFKRKVRFIIVFLTSVFFHYSNLLIIPFITLLKLKSNYLLYVTTIIAILYIFNINEYIVKHISDILNLDLYMSIKTYSENGQGSYRYGFQPDLFLYTIGLNYIYYSVNKFFLKNQIEQIVKVYMIASLPYYIFGFAAFSNRYGVIAWYSTMFINPLIIYQLFKRDNKIFTLVFLFFTTFSSVIFYLKLMSL